MQQLLPHLNYIARVEIPELEVDDAIVPLALVNRQGAEGDPATRARTHFARAVELSHGMLAQPFVSLAEAVAVVEQDRDEFEYLLHTALAIDPDFMTAWRMNNLVSQRRARWLLSRTDLLFLN